MACIEDIKKAAKGMMTDEEVDALYSALQKIRRTKRGSPADINREMLAEAENMIETWVSAMKIEKRNRAFNIIARARIMEGIERYKARTPDATDADGLINYMVGLGQGGDSIGSRMSSKENGVVGGVRDKITQANLWDSLNSRNLDREIAQEMWEIGRPDGKPGISGNKDAQKLAEIFNDGQKAVVQMQNDAGAWIDSLPGYIVRQTHDATKIRRKGGDKGQDWVSYTNDRIDWDQTARGLTEAERLEYLQTVYTNLSTGDHYVSKGVADNDKFLAFKGPANIAKKISSERVLHFKSADDWFDYNKEYGSGNLAESFFYGVERGARNAALMEGFGTNPRSMFKGIIDVLHERNKGDIKVINKLRGHRGADTLEWYMMQITGENKRPGSVGLSMVGAGIRAFESFSKLGGASLSSVNDLATMASQAKFNGIGYLKGFQQGIDNLMQGRTSGEKRQLADILGVGYEGMMGQVLNRWGASDHVPGRLNSLVQSTFKFTGLNWWTDAHKTGFATMLSRNLGVNKGKSWSKLDPDLRQSLGLYLKPAEWDIIRTQPTRNIDGAEYITPESAKNLTDAQVRGMIGEKAGPLKIRRFRDQLETSVRSYFVDQSDSAIPTPGDREMALLRGKTTPGTWAGEGMRFFAQFKAFPVTFMTKAMGKFMINGKMNKQGMAMLFAMSTAMGYMAMTLKDIAKNRTPRDPTANPVKVFLAAAQQGGGLGIYGDFLFGEGSRFGTSAMGTVAGPAFGSMNELLNIGFGLKKELTEKLSGNNEFDFKTTNKIVNFVKHHAPIVNWFWTKKAFDGLIFNHIQENINPGYLERTRARMQKYNEQDFLFGKF